VGLALLERYDPDAVPAVDAAPFVLMDPPRREPDEVVGEPACGRGVTELVDLLRANAAAWEARVDLRDFDPWTRV